MDLKVPGAAALTKEEKEGKSDGHPSNREFLFSLFGDVPAGAAALVCSFQGDPTTDQGWHPRDAARVDQVCVANNNNYFNCSTFAAGPGEQTRAKKEAFVAYHALVLDDVGAKIPATKLKEVTPSWRLETSPGNFQVGFILSPPITDAQELSDLQERVKQAGLCDPGAMGIARWMRLPGGINGKPQDRVNGEPFRCRLETWAPDRRFTVSALADELRLPNGPSNSAPVGPKPTRRGNDVSSFPADENPVLTALKQRGLYKRVLEPGKHDVTCPWTNEHTNQIDGGACYWEPDEAHPVGGYKCQHSHGEKYRINELLGFLQVDPEEAQNKPIIKLVGGAFDRVLRAAEEALSASGDIYQSGGSIAALHRDVQTGEARVEVFAEPRLKRELSKVAIWKQPAAEGRWRVVDPPQGYVAGLFKAGHFDVLPKLNGIARQPYLKRSGELVLRAGYDSETGMYAVFDPSKFGNLNFSRASAVAALQELKDLLSEFHFAKDHDKSAALSAILTAALRPSLPLAPAFNITASSPGSGKSYLADLIAAFATPGHPPKASYPASSDEATKAVLSHLMPSPAVLIFDDMTRDWLAFGSINRMLTSERMSDRLLTTNRVQEVSTRTLILGTGNNIEPLHDLRRRVLSIRIQPMSANPALLTYTGRPVEKVRANRERFVGLALQIVMAWREAAPNRIAEFPIASYGEWSDLCREPLLWLGEPDPATAFRHQLEDDPDADALRDFLLSWHERRGDRPTMVRQLIALAGESYTDDRLKEALEELPVWEGGRLSPTKLGWYIKNRCGRIAGDLMVQPGPKGERRTWRVVQVEQLTPPSPPLKVEKEGPVDAEAEPSATPIKPAQEPTEQDSTTP
jgi:hypothetical protein